MRANRVALACLIAWSLQSGVSFAEADWWDKLSGPGPHPGLFIDYRFLCVANSVDQDDYRALNNPATSRPVDEKGRTYLIFLDPHDRTALPTLWHRKLPLPVTVPTQVNDQTVATYRKQKAEQDCKQDQRLRGYLFTTAQIHWSWDKWYDGIVPSDSPLCSESEAAKNRCHELRKVRIATYGIGYLVRIKHGWAVSESFSVNRFWGPAFKHFYRVAFTPGVEFAPYAVHSDAPGSHRLKLQAGLIVFPRGFSSSDFCNNPTVSCAPVRAWQSGTEIVPRAGVVVDLGL